PPASLARQPDTLVHELLVERMQAFRFPNYFLPGLVRVHRRGLALEVFFHDLVLFPAPVVVIGSPGEASLPARDALQFDIRLRNLVPVLVQVVVEVGADAEIALWTL